MEFGGDIGDKKFVEVCMSVEEILSLCNQGLMVIAYIIGPPLAAAMSVGLFVAVFQAATQIQEASLSFVPKMTAVGITLIFSARWSIAHMSAFVHEVMSKIQAAGP